MRAPLSPFKADLAEIGRQIDSGPDRNRRRFLKLGLMLPAAPALLGLHAQPAQAQAQAQAQAAGAAPPAPREITIATWGHDDIGHLTTAFGAPFKRDTGINVVFDGSGPSEGKIQSMVSSGTVEWDVCDTDGYAALRMGSAGLLSAIDYNIVAQQRVIPPFRMDYGVAGYSYSFVLAYNAQLYPNLTNPGWAQFWDVKRYPGKRAVWKWMIGALEAAAMSMGTNPAGIYPLDIVRLLSRLREIRQHLVFWESGSQIREWMLDRTVTMACLWHSRAAQLAIETDSGIAWSFRQGILCPGVWIVPKHNPAGKEAFNLLASMQIPGRQIALTNLRRVGPANPEAATAMPESLRPFDPLQPEARAMQVALNSHWWARNFDMVQRNFAATFNQG